MDDESLTARLSHSPSPQEFSTTPNPETWALKNVDIPCRHDLRLRDINESPDMFQEISPDPYTPVTSSKGITDTFRRSNGTCRHAPRKPTWPVILFPNTNASALFILAIGVAAVILPSQTSASPPANSNNHEYRYYYNYDGANTYQDGSLSDANGSPNQNGGSIDSMDAFGINGDPQEWTHQEWVKMTGRVHPKPKCTDIPKNLTLCQGIGYEKMMLPNLLGHDSMREVTQQAGSWVPLVNIACHPNVRIFLCSLFSPVCLDRLIYPCRSLCESVQASCLGRMKTYGFDWPEMLKCEKFPKDNDMCIVLDNDSTVKADNNCTACKHPLTHEALIDSFCRSDVALRVSVKDFRDVHGNKELVVRNKKKKPFKYKGMSKKQARELTPIIEGGASCSCSTINTTQRYLLMGNRSGNQLIVTFGMKWDKKNKEFRKGIKAIRKGNKCEGIFKELSANGMETSKNGEKKERRKRRKKDRKGGKGKGKKRRRKGKKGRKGKGKGKGKGKKKRGNKGETSDNSVKRRGKMSKSELEDRAINNFMKAAN